MKPIAFTDPDVAALFETYGEDIKAKLMALRQLVFEVADETEGVGEIEEALRWGQPCYLTTASKSGSTIRIDKVGSQTDKYAVYFNCQSSLVSSFRQIFPEEFEYVGNRAIILDVADEVPVDALAECISMALTYHLRKRRKIS